MPAPARLHRSPDVRRVLRRGERSGSRLVVVHVHRRADDGPARVTAVASRRVGGAVERNRAKRLLREAVRRTGLRDGHDVALVARATTAGSTLDPVLDDLRAVLARLDLDDVEHAFEPAVVRA